MKVAVTVDVPSPSPSAPVMIACGAATVAQDEDVLEVRRFHEDRGALSIALTPLVALSFGVWRTDAPPPAPRESVDWVITVTPDIILVAR